MKKKSQQRGIHRLYFTKFMQIYSILGCRARTKPVSCQSIHLIKGSASKAPVRLSQAHSTISISKKKYHSDLCFKTSMNPLQYLTPSALFLVKPSALWNNEQKTMLFSAGSTALNADSQQQSDIFHQIHQLHRHEWFCSRASKTDYKLHTIEVRGGWGHCRGNNTLSQLVVMVTFKNIQVQFPACSAFTAFFCYFIRTGFTVLK